MVTEQKTRQSGIKMTGVSKNGTFDFCNFRTVPRIDCQILAGKRPPKNLEGKNWSWTSPKLHFLEVGIWKAWFL